ncbi:MAG: hypothetical protein QOK15_2642 [Nocardioidaceae bacterium]|nr:hypothetical protein [Nocardioidaceae bacterium]
MTKDICCDDFVRTTALSRRRFLGAMAAAGTTAVATSVFGEAVLQASFGAVPGGNVLVVLSFRGGVDGLGLVVPHGDPAYYAARPSIAVPRTSLLAADAMFGLHPELAPLQWLWDGGELAAVQAVGLPQPNRSHFSAMEEIEDADPGSTLRQGWVNRMVGLDAGATAVDAVHIGSATPPTLVEGPTPTLATMRLADIRLAGAEGSWGDRRRSQLRTMWGGTTGPLAVAARSALATEQKLQPVEGQSYRPTVAYPTEWPGTDLSAALQDAAHLIKSDMGTEVVSVDFGSWDMHDGYGTLAAGEMQLMAGSFARSVDAFLRDLGDLRSRVTLVTISEFGRRVAQNGNKGLDHGWGNMMMVMGGGVRGGQYYGQWPGLAAGKLVDGDLRVTTDYRQVLGEIVHRRFPDKDVTQVFPGVAYNPLGLLA